MSRNDLTDRGTISPTNIAKQFRFLLTAFIFSCGVVFVAWVMPTFVSRSSLEFLVFTAFWLGAFVSGFCYWYRDKLFLQREPDAEPAELIWERSKVLGTPYAVYLRNFEFERRQNRFPRPFSIGQYSGSSRRVEVMLAKMLAGWLPILALADPQYPFSMPGVHRFRRLAPPWPDFLEQLLSGSDLIIIYLTESSAGLEYEMRLVLELDLAEKVLVIVGKTTRIKHTAFKHLLYESSPEFEDSLNATLTFFMRRQEGYKLEEESLAKLNAVIPRRILQLTVIVLASVIAFVIWGKPPLLDPMYWKWNASMSEVRKTQERAMETREEVRKTAEAIRKFEEDFNNRSLRQWQKNGKWTHDLSKGPLSDRQTRSWASVVKVPEGSRIRESSLERTRHPKRTRSRQ